jgi:hypothetical protein
MIQLVFDSVANLVPEWENGQERLIFCLTPASVRRSELLHERLGAAGATKLDSKAAGMVALQYEGDLARQARVILELPDDVWNHLASQVDELLEARQEES